MSFRGRGKKQRKEWRVPAHDWTAWLKEHADLVAESSLPPSVLESEDHWWDFLEHGTLYHHEDTSFHVGELSIKEKAALLSLLMTAPIYMGQEGIGWDLIRDLIVAVKQCESL